jgi:hypothetical protein
LRRPKECSSWVRQPKKYRTIGRIDEEIRLKDISRPRAIHPVRSQASIQVIRLNLQPPAHMILRPGKLQLVSKDLKIYICRDQRGRRSRAGNQFHLAGGIRVERPIEIRRNSAENWQIPA